MAKTVRVRVPGTTANCGPGFDAVGIACKIYNELELTLLEEEEILLEVEGEGVGQIAADKSNIVWQTIAMVLKKTNQTAYRGARLKMKNGVPLSRGLGSSAAAIVAGLAAANAAVDGGLTRSELLDMATAVEGHPDNVAPAIFGGMTVSIVESGKVKTLPIRPALALKLIVAIPSFDLPTKLAREVLPAQVPRGDAIFNLAHAALLVGAMTSGDVVMLRAALQDRLHQPYRIKLIPGMEDVLKAAQENGAIGAVLSGAGPCLIAFTPAGQEQIEKQIGESMVRSFAAHKVDAVYKSLEIDEDGVQVL